MFRRIFVPSLLATILSISAVAQNSGLVAAYSFDEGSGTTVQDASGNGNTGSLSNATWAASGRFGSALSFNGTSAWVVVNNSPSLTLSTGMTLEAWVNPSAISSSWRDVIYKSVDIYYLEATSSTGGVPSAGASTLGNVLGTAVLPANTWSHIAATYDGATLTLYVNGNPVATKAIAGTLSSSTGALYIGGDSRFGQYFKGLIDEVRIYNVALTQAQIQTDMTTPIGTGGGTDTTPPSAPTSLAATAVSSSQVNLSWTASTDNVAVTNYLVERCQGASCTSFTQVGTSATTSFSDTGVSASTAYSYRVRATDAANNLSGYSNVSSTTTLSSGGGGTAGLVAAYSFDEGSGTTAADASGNGNSGTLSNATWTTSGKFGNALTFNGTNAWVQVASAPSLNLTTAMTLEAWVKPASVTSAWRDVIYKSVDIYYLEGTSTTSGRPASGATGKTTVFGTSALPLNTWSHLASTYDGATLKLYVNGALVSSTPNTGPLSTSTNPLFIGGDSRFGQYFNGAIDDVRVYNVALSQSQIQSDMNTPVSGGGGGSTDTSPPTAPANLGATPVSSSQINLTWSASTDNVGVTGYLIERCAGASCANFAQIGTSTTTSFSNTGLAASTSYSYRVRATDAANNLSSYSNVATATTLSSGGGGGTPGLVAAYAFDEGSGTNVSDASGNNNTGAIANATWTTGKNGSALSFNGTNALVQIASSASLNLTTAMTLEAWVNPAVNSSAWRDVIFKSVDIYYLEGTSSTSGRPAAGATGKTTVFGTSALPLNTWSHLAATYDGANFKLYVNGALVATQANTGTLSTSTNPLFIGGDTRFGQYFNGKIDDVRVYNVALSQSQIQTDMNTPVAGGGGGGGGGTLAVSPRQAAITSQQTQQFTANQSGVTWLVDSIAGGNSTTGTISSSGLYTPPGTAGSHTIQAQGSTESASATVYVTNYGGTFTYHNDLARSGSNLNETVLSPANVTASAFGKLYTFSVDGQVYTEPLYVPNVTVAGKGTFNVVYVGTEHDSVYAFDADGSTTTPLWKKSFVNGTTVIPVPPADTGETGDITPEIGITGTPVIDASTGTLYVVAKTKETSGGTTSYVQRLHAVDITSGAEKFGGPVVITASVPGTGAGGNGTSVPFVPLRENQRAGLLLLNGVVYIAFGSHGDNPPYHGWVLGYSASTLQQVMAYCTTPNGAEAGIWQGGGALAADAANGIYAVVGNGDFSVANHNYGNGILRLSTSGTVADYFVPFNTATLSTGDRDVGSGGPLLLPDQPGTHPHLLVTAGKEGRIYLLDRDNLGQFNATSDQVVQELPGALASDGSIETGNFGPPSYWNGFVYFGAYPDRIKAFKLTNGLLSTTATSQSSETFQFRGTRPTISSNGTANGILWAVEKTSDTTPGVLHAYNAGNLATEFWTSNDSGTRDQMDIGQKFAVPTIANGKVFVGTRSTVTVYGLLP